MIRDLKRPRWSLAEAMENEGLAAHMGSANTDWLAAMRFELVELRGSRQLIEIGEILITPAGLLVRLEIAQGDEMHAHPVKVRGNTARVTIGEPHTVDAGLNLDPIRRHPYADHAIRLQKKVWLQLRQVKTKLPQRVHQPRGVLRMHRHPNVQIRCGSRGAMEGDRVTADDQVLNAVVVQQPQELFEVPGQ
jgi:hypothetical protein